MPSDFDVEEIELLLYADNESSLYPMKKAIIANAKKRIEAGTYNAELGIKGWLYWVDKAAQQYCKEFGCAIKQTFPLSSRREVAKEISEREYAAIIAGDYGALKVGAARTPATPRKATQAQLKSAAKYHTQYKGPTDRTGSRIIVKTLSTGKSKTVPYDYAARDAHESALRVATGSKAALQGVEDGKGGKYWG
jgi:hypothetical protein